MKIVNVKPKLIWTALIRSNLPFRGRMVALLCVLYLLTPLGRIPSSIPILGRLNGFRVLASVLKYLSKTHGGEPDKLLMTKVFGSKV